MAIGIYQIRNNVNGKIYIGKTVDIQTRKKQHFNSLHRGVHSNKRLQEDFHRYGVHAFEFSTLEECEKAQLDRKESEWCYNHNVWNEEVGYNEGYLRNYTRLSVAQSEAFRNLFLQTINQYFANELKQYRDLRIYLSNDTTFLGLDKEQIIIFIKEGSRKDVLTYDLFFEYKTEDYGREEYIEVSSVDYEKATMELYTTDIGYISRMISIENNKEEIQKKIDEIEFHLGKMHADTFDIYSFFDLSNLNEEAKAHILEEFYEDGWTYLEFEQLGAMELLESYLESIVYQKDIHSAKTVLIDLLTDPSYYTITEEPV